MEIEEDIINKLLDKILTKDNDFLRILDCFLLDRLEQYSDDPEILFGIKKIKDLIPTIENLIPDIEILSNRISNIESKIFVCGCEINLPELQDEIMQLKWEVFDMKEKLKIRD